MNNSITADLITLVTELARETEATSGVTKQFQQALARLTHAPAPEAPAGDWTEQDVRECERRCPDYPQRSHLSNRQAAICAALAFASERMAAVRGENAQLASEFNAEVDGANDLRARLTAAEDERDAASQSAANLSKDISDLLGIVRTLRAELEAANASLASLAAPEPGEDDIKAMVAALTSLKHTGNAEPVWETIAREAYRIAASRRAPAARMPGVDVIEDAFLEGVQAGVTESLSWTPTVTGMHRDPTPSEVLWERSDARAVHAAASAAQPAKES